MSPYGSTRQPRGESDARIAGWEEKKKINCIPQCDDRNASERRMPTVASGQGSNWQHITASPCRKLKELDAAAAAVSGVAATLCSVARASGIILPLQIKLHILWILHRIAPELHYVAASPTLSLCSFYIYDLYTFVRMFWQDQLHWILFTRICCLHFYSQDRKSLADIKGPMLQMFSV